MQAGAVFGIFIACVSMAPDPRGRVVPQHALQTLSRVVGAIGTDHHPCVLREAHANATTVVHVQGAAIAGGCALAMACDIVTAQPDAKFGYPVHALGISPAVTLPVLLPAAGGRARSLLMGGDLVTGKIMHAHGIVHQLCDNPDALVQRLLQRGTHASHATKQWLNELEGALCDKRFDGPAGVR